MAFLWRNHHGTTGPSAPLLARYAPALDRNLYRLRRRAAIALLNRRSITRKSPNHDLPQKLVVSLTSFPKRFDTLHLTIRSVLTQSVRPDIAVLWIAEGDRQYLPEQVLQFQDVGLCIRYCDDLRSYKKIVPSLRAFPDAYIITLDDDICYPRRWLEALVRSYRANPVDVVCHRAHRIVCDDSGHPMPYNSWQWNIGGTEGSPRILPTGVGGVLYSPGALDPRVTDSTVFMDLCPTTDDIWLYWMLRLAGSRVRVLNSRKLVVYWPNSQVTALLDGNTGEMALNDKAVRALANYFGLSWDVTGVQSVELRTPETLT